MKTIKVFDAATDEFVLEITPESETEFQDYLKEIKHSKYRNLVFRYGNEEYTFYKDPMFIISYMEYYLNCVFSGQKINLQKYLGPAYIRP